MEFNRCILYKRLQSRSEFCENQFINSNSLLKGVMNFHLSASQSIPIALFIDVWQKQLSMEHVIFYSMLQWYQSTGWIEHWVIL